MDYYCIVYESIATIKFDEASLRELLTQAWQLNNLLGITGMLAYNEGRFLQVLEGREAAVRHVYTKIAADLRHGKFEKLADGPVAYREFTDWHMGFITPPGSHIQLPGFVPLDDLLATSPVRQLLHDFLAEGLAPIR